MIHWPRGDLDLAAVDGDGDGLAGRRRAGRGRCRPRSRSPSGGGTRTATGRGRPPDAVPGPRLGLRHGPASGAAGPVGTGSGPRGCGPGTRPGTSGARPPPRAASTVRARRSSSGPGGQVTPGEMLSHTSMSRSRSDSRPWPSSMRSRIFSSQPLPSRQGVHWPHDSRWKNRTMRQAARTVQVVWSMAITDAGPGHGPDRGDGLVGQAARRGARARARARRRRRG